MAMVKLLAALQPNIVGANQKELQPPTLPCAPHSFLDTRSPLDHYQLHMPSLGPQPMPAGGVNQRPVLTTAWGRVHRRQVRIKEIFPSSCTQARSGVRVGVPNENLGPANGKTLIAPNAKLVLAGSASAASTPNI
ncbi:hypothetical protein VOLCADRAFT_88946 [Volvox carteri f. nagariensis]|uniref:Uncharacterized protein n=1 Tax=Volvox carteri f. nagariensis TaxID=3068 RepID=D8TQD7_VOLCA|nr:uncharacterized protein VOLCADRAFT_88946 [Volvox carteri f. nagariensis]EFJ50515.1 hypothetical protein VOLCADRAFT_88946 [Volvox carteri f. nagariensis]|eukprot:XP_002948640.1 hypothetical protein VOLCADRAFT_88946 [Volvox carteri f. nagariensis]